jgi:hypothetical protein
MIGSTPASSHASMIPPKPRKITRVTALRGQDNPRVARALWDAVAFVGAPSRRSVRIRYPSTAEGTGSG